MADLDDKALGEIEGELLRGMGIDTSVALNLVDAVRKARTQNRLLKGAIDSQDERERQAGIVARIPYEEHGCDWPDAVAERISWLRTQIAAVRALRKHQAQLTVADLESGNWREVIEWAEVVRTLDGDGATKGEMRWLRRSATCATVTDACANA